MKIYEVPTATLKTDGNPFNPPGPGYDSGKFIRALITDTEGSERRVIRGGNNSLKAHKDLLAELKEELKDTVFEIQCEGGGELRFDQEYGNAFKNIEVRGSSWEFGQEPERDTATLELFRREFRDDYVVTTEQSIPLEKLPDIVLGPNDFPQEPSAHFLLKFLIFSELGDSKRFLRIGDYHKPHKRIYRAFLEEMGACCSKRIIMKCLGGGSLSFDSHSFDPPYILVTDASGDYGMEPNPMRWEETVPIVQKALPGWQVSNRDPFENGPFGMPLIPREGVTLRERKKNE